MVIVGWKRGPVETSERPDPKVEDSREPNWRYSEGTLLKELHDYLASTYSAHYTAGDQEAPIQAIDGIHAAGNSRGFCIGSIQKYAARQGKKKGQERADLLKIIHYALFAMHFSDVDARKGKVW